MNTSVTAPELLAVPNLAGGSHALEVDGIVDRHGDVDHGRTVLTLAGTRSALVEDLMTVARYAVAHIDLRQHTGVHPRFGAIDVLPLIPFRSSTADALHAAGEVAERLEDELQIPVFLYGQADPSGRSLPDLRRYLRTTPHDSHPTAGVACLGVRGPLIAFNVNFRGDLAVAKRVARGVRAPDIRALGFELASRGLVQVSMNLIAPGRVGPKFAFERVMSLAHDLKLVDCEVVGLVPHPNLAELDGLPLRKPVRSIEQALEEKGVV